MTEEDVIVAVATPPGVGALALIRLSGPGARDVAGRVLKPAAGKSAPWKARFVRRVVAVDAAGAEIDDGIVVCYDAPRSFTGEDVVEFTGHGGVLVVQRVMEAFEAAGARAAGPGEFSQRAFLNGRMDLTEAEGIMDLIQARTDLALRAARRQMHGALREEVEALRAAAVKLTAHYEAWLDFPEEGIDPDTGRAMRARMIELAVGIASLLETAARGRILRDGLRLVIAGAPNAGKSSILNCLLGFERAIVSPEEGTTRDTVEEMLNLGGVPVRLIDTAGLRQADQGIERMGIERTQAAMTDADLVLEVVDGTRPPQSVRRVDAEPEKCLLVINKADLPSHPGWDEAEADCEACRGSCVTRHGLDALVARLRDTVVPGLSSWEDNPVAINSRHQRELERAATALRAAIDLFDGGGEPELVAEELRETLDAIGTVGGRVDAEEILGAIFGTFCIGK